MQHQFRDPRPYTYDDQGNTYTTGHAPHHASDYSLTTPAYPQYEGSNAYYVPPQTAGGINEATHSGPYYRSMTPSLSHSRYPSASRDTRGYSSPSQGLVHPSSSSPTSSASGIYAPQNQYFSSQYVSNSANDHRAHPPSAAQTQFIPTPSEMAHTYNNYGSIIPRSPTVPPPEHYSANSINYPAPPEVLSPSNSHPHRPSRILTARPRSGTINASPTSATSPSGERFPCEKCGKTFSRSHDRKRHHETQHLATPIIHRCRWCEKEFSRADSLKRHLDNGCDEAP